MTCEGRAGSYRYLPSFLPHLPDSHLLQSQLITNTDTQTPRVRSKLGVVWCHVDPQPGPAGPAGHSVPCQLSGRYWGLAALDAGAHCRGCVPGAGGHRLCCQPLLVPGRTGACDHGDDGQGRWGVGRDGRQVCLHSCWLQVR